MHTLYSTECIILGSIDSGEANRYISLFTKDIGLVRAVAKSVREEKSKLRYSLQDYSITLVTLVRGKEIWRITGAEERYSLFKEVSDNSEKVLVITRILNLLKRLVQGEEKNDYLFECLSKSFEFTKENNIDKEALKNFEHLLVLRMLYSLGYIAKIGDFDELLSSVDINEDLLKSVASVRIQIISIINNALKETHL